MDKNSVIEFIKENISIEELKDMILEKAIENTKRHKKDIESLLMDNDVFVHTNDYCKIINNCPSDYEGEIFIEINSSKYGSNELEARLIKDNFIKVGITTIPNNYELAKVIENSYEQHFPDDNIIVLKKKNKTYLISMII